MHELSIAEAVLQIALDHAERPPAGARASSSGRSRRVVRVEVKVGHLRQVVPDALTFAFGLVAQGTAAEGAELAIEEVPAAGRCRDCGARGALPGFPLVCERCGSWDVEVQQGEELLVDSLELEERETVHGH
jgi:hydrogenase nickel incorporation protein HypA/HybF